MSPVDPDRRDSRDAAAVGVMVDLTGPSAGADHVGTRGRHYGPDVLGVLWVLGAGLAVLLPALIHGLYLGPYDILSTIGLTAQHGVVVHNPSMRDLTSLFIPFTEQNWTQVHQGHLPLWNPYSGLGMPLAFNWESAPFGLPALVGYLVPLRFAYTAGLQELFLRPDVPSPKSWSAFIGIDVSVKQSGTWRGRSKLSKRGNAYLRKRMFQAAWGAMQNAPEFKAYYQRLRDQGRSYKESLLMIARKQLRIAYILWTTGETYQSDMLKT